jgi:hypothetical protein
VRSNALNLAFLIHTQHQRPVWWIHVKTHDIAHLVDKKRVSGQLESLAAMWLERERSPDPAHRRLVQSRCLRHGACRPMRAIGRFGFQGARNYRFDLRIAQLARLSRSWLIEQSIHTALDKPRSPLESRLQVHL